MHIDLNADLGEGCGDDAAILRYVSSANIACGWHAGDARTMRDTARAALAHGVALGAHPSFPDRAHFGRRAMQRAPAQVYQDMLDQIGALDEIVREEGGQLQHVKPHGALYNQAAGDEALAEAIARAVHDYHPGLKLVWLAGGALVRQARLQGLNAVEEVFADRAYLADGSLAPRELPGAVIVNPVQAVAQTLRLVEQGQVTSQDGRTVQLRADSVCLHGDSAHALDVARRLRARLEARGIQVCPQRAA